jgi:hypothetical protein
VGRTTEQSDGKYGNTLLGSAVGSCRARIIRVDAGNPGKRPPGFGATIDPVDQDARERLTKLLLRADHFRVGDPRRWYGATLAVNAPDCAQPAQCWFTRKNPGFQRNQRSIADPPDLGHVVVSRTSHLGDKLEQLLSVRLGTTAPTPVAAALASTTLSGMVRMGTMAEPFILIEQASA